MMRLLNETPGQRGATKTHPSDETGRLPACADDPLHSRRHTRLLDPLSRVASLQHEPLLRFLSRRVGSRQEAEDIIQDAYVRILAVDRTEEIRNLDRYLWRSALNITTDYGRSRQRWNRIAKVLSAQQDSSAPSAEVVAAAREQWAILSQTVPKLPPKQYEAFTLRIMQGLPFEEVGHAMRLSSRMAKVYVARTLVYLQGRLDESDHKAV